MTKTVTNKRIKQYQMVMLSCSGSVGRVLDVIEMSQVLESPEAQCGGDLRLSGSIL